MKKETAGGIKVVSTASNNQEAPLLRDLDVLEEVSGKERISQDDATASQLSPFSGTELGRYELTERHLEFTKTMLLYPH